MRQHDRLPSNVALTVDEDVAWDVRAGILNFIQGQCTRARAHDHAEATRICSLYSRMQSHKNNHFSVASDPAVSDPHATSYLDFAC